MTAAKTPKLEVTDTKAASAQPQAPSADPAADFGPEAIKREQEVADQLNKQVEQNAIPAVLTGHEAAYEELPKPQNDPEFGQRYPTGAQVHQRVLENAPEVAEQADAARHGGKLEGAEAKHTGKDEAAGKAAESGAKKKAH